MARYSIGIDLGTTNSAVSYVDLAGTAARGREQTMLPIPQVTGVGAVENKWLLPSFLYLPNAQEFPAHGVALPWDSLRQDIVVGEFARAHGSKVPMRLVSSAKSWLCHPGVDRSAAILPWGAPAEVGKLSPVEASAQFLDYLRRVWDNQYAGKQPELALSDARSVMSSEWSSSFLFSDSSGLKTFEVLSLRVFQSWETLHQRSQPSVAKM